METPVRGTGMGLRFGEVVAPAAAYGTGCAVWPRSPGISRCAWGLSVCPTNMANPVLFRQCLLPGEDLLLFSCRPYPSLPSRPPQVATPRTSVLRALASGKVPGRSSTRSEAPGAGLSARSGLVHTNLRCPTLPAPAVSIIIDNHPLLHSTSPFLPALTQRTPKRRSPSIVPTGSCWCGCRRGDSSHPPAARPVRPKRSAAPRRPSRRDARSAAPCRVTEQAINIKADPCLASPESLFPVWGRGGALGDQSWRSGGRGRTGNVRNRGLQFKHGGGNSAWFDVAQLWPAELRASGSPRAPAVDNHLKKQRLMLGGPGQTFLGVLVAQRVCTPYRNPYQCFYVAPLQTGVPSSAE